LELGDRWFGAGGRDVSLGVVDRAGQDVKLVVQVVERRLRDHELAFAQFEFTRSLP